MQSQMRIPATRLNHIREYDAATDCLSIRAEVYSKLDFTPQIIQFMTGFKFVYLNPR